MYIKGLVDYLKQQGHSVLIIAGMPPQAFEEHEMYYEDELLKTVLYQQGNTDVLGLVLTNETTEEIYSKYREAWVSSYCALLKKYEGSWDILHMQAFTSATGIALMKAVKKNNPGIKIISTYHVPVSCPKGTLMVANTLQNCEVTPTVATCTACMIATRSGMSFSFVKKIVPFLPTLSMQQVGTGLRLKFLVQHFFQSFSLFDSLTDQWQVFYNQIKTALQKMNVPPGKINLIRHGVADVFFAQQHEKHSKQIFLYASRFKKVKGFETLIKAWTMLDEKDDRELWMAGDTQGEAIENIDGAKAFAGRKDVQWKGMQTQEQLADLMKKADCIIIPSEWMEIGPLVFHEAIAGRANVIASDIGGCTELAAYYNSSAIQLFKAGDAGALKDCINNFTYQYPDCSPISQSENYATVLNSYRLLQNKLPVV